MIGAVTILVNSVLSPVIDVYISQTTHEQLHRDREEALSYHRQCPWQVLITFTMGSTVKGSLVKYMFQLPPTRFHRRS